MTEIKANQIDMVPVEKLVPNPRNNNKHTDAQIERLSKLIKHTGFRNPIIVSKRNGFMVAGHGRLEAAKRLGLKELPVVYQDFESEAEEYQYLTADNEIARWAELDHSSLLDDIKELGLEDSDLELFGLPDLVFNVDEVEMPELPDGEKGDIEQITFTLTEAQALEVRNAINMVKADYKNVLDGESNSNGSSIAYICERFTSGG